MGRPLFRLDCDDTETMTHKRNVACSSGLLAAIIAHHSTPEIAPVVVQAVLPPIPNEAIAHASSVAFPSWVNAIKRIQQAVCIEYGITLSELCSQRRNVSVVRPRQIGMYLCKMLTDRSFPEIGRRFGGRDHTTVISAVRRVGEFCKSDDKFRARVETLADTLAETMGPV